MILFCLVNIKGVVRIFRCLTNAVPMVRLRLIGSNGTFWLCGIKFFRIGLRSMDYRLVVVDGRNVIFKLRMGSRDAFCGCHPALALGYPPFLLLMEGLSLSFHRRIDVAGFRSKTGLLSRRESVAVCRARATLESRGLICCWVFVNSPLGYALVRSALRDGSQAWPAAGAACWWKACRVAGLDPEGAISRPPMLDAYIKRGRGQLPGSDWDPQWFSFLIGWESHPVTVNPQGAGSWTQRTDRGYWGAKHPACSQEFLRQTSSPYETSYIFLGIGPCRWRWHRLYLKFNPWISVCSVFSSEHSGPPGGAFCGCRVSLLQGD